MKTLKVLATIVVVTIPMIVFSGCSKNADADIYTPCHQDPDCWDQGNGGGGGGGNTGAGLVIGQTVIGRVHARPESMTQIYVLLPDGQVVRTATSSYVIWNDFRNLNYDAYDLMVVVKITSMYSNAAGADTYGDMVTRYPVPKE